MGPPIHGRGHGCAAAILEGSFAIPKTLRWAHPGPPDSFCRCLLRALVTDVQQKAGVKESAPSAVHSDKKLGMTYMSTGRNTAVLSPFLTVPQRLHK